MKKTLVFSMHFKPLVEKNVAKHCVFYAFAKNSVHSGVLDEFRPRCCKNIVNVSVFGCIWPEIFDREQQQ